MWNCSSLVRSGSTSMRGDLCSSWYRHFPLSEDASLSVCPDLPFTYEY